MTVFWTPARETQLAALVSKGLPASKIGEALGCSRNAVVGKVIRGRGCFGKLDGWPGRRNRVETRPAPATIIRSAPPPEPMPFLQAIDEGRCLWFAGEAFDPNGPDMPVCGGERHAGTRYCARHASMVGRRDVA